MACSCDPGIQRTRNCTENSYLARSLGTEITSNRGDIGVSANSNLPKSEESIAHTCYAIEGPPTILVVDDDDDIRLLMVQLLRTQGYRVTEASTAGEAESNALQNPPHLILMDLSMPGTDGLTAIWNIRKQPAMAAVPVIIVSAHDAFDLRAEAAAAGCCGYLTKPLDTIQLQTAIKSALEASY